MRIDPTIWYIILYLFIVAAVTLILIRFLRWVHRKIFMSLNKDDSKSRYDPTTYSFLQNAISASLILLALIVFIFSVPELRKYGEKIFVGAGLATIAVGFASQAALSNIVGGIFIVLFRPFRVHDIISVNDYMGVVEDITLRHTVIRNFENRRIVIPNSVISSETILNSSISDQKICNFFEISIAFESDIQKAFQIIREEALRHPNCIDNRTDEMVEADGPIVKIRIIQWLDSGIQIRANIWSEDPILGFELKCDLHRILLERFRKEGIEIPYPHRVILNKVGYDQS